MQQTHASARLDDPIGSLPWPSLHRLLNVRLHREALLVFSAIVWAHVLEHAFQAIQIFVLGWPRPQALGVLGWLFPRLIQTEWLHYTYAIVMLLGLALLRPAFAGRARLWWNIAVAIQFWHHIEHALLLVQALSGYFLFGAKAPTSVLQLFFPRVELHITYNLLVLLPMIIGMYLHRYAPPEPSQAPICRCCRVGDKVTR